MRRIAVVMCSVVSIVGMIGVAAAPAGAALLPTNEICTGAGRLIEVGTAPTTWSLSGSGFCGRANFPVYGLETVKLAGFGVSDSQGLCSNTLLVTNFAMLVRASFTPVAVKPAAHTTFELWFSPVTLFPLVMPFLVSPATDPGSIGGAGLMFSHIFLQCGNDGDKPSVQFDWAQLF